MSKLPAKLYDFGRRIVTASQASIKTGYHQLREKNIWEALKSEARATFNVRNTAATLAVVALTSVGVYTFANKVNETEKVYQVYVDGNFQGLVRDTGLIAETVRALGNKLDSQVTYQAVHQSVDSTSEGSIAYNLVKSTKTFSDMVAVRVNGVDVVYVENQATAEQLIEKLKAHYKKDTNATVTLADSVDFVAINDEMQNITSIDEAFEMILTGTNEKKMYVVSRGDSMWDIAAKNEMTVEELHEANPDIQNIDAIAEGQQINLIANDPLIDVTATIEETREVTTNYEVEYKDDNSVDLGTEKVLQEGKEGKKKQVVRVIKKNGIVETEEVISEEVLEEPVKEIIAKGTRKQTYSSYSGSAQAASGNWAYPVGGGYISSHYGESRGGKAHLAIDIAASTGTTVYASNNGTVVFAGDAGDGYGNCIRISHGGGMVSVYAHLSSMSVSSGQAVQKGQKIGGVGNTGWSTGAHLHYEMRINGAQVNPAPYM